jgi:hypothetical protein
MSIKEKTTNDDTQRGLYHKFNVNRTDGKDAPGGTHEGDEYFVLNLTKDKYALRALRVYATACQVEYPALAADLFAKCRIGQIDEFVTVPETTLPNGLVVPSFQVGKYLSCKDEDGKLTINPTDTPWTEINYHDARAAAADAGYKLITETQALALAYNIATQDANWTGGKVGEGKLFQGLREGDCDEAQPGEFVPDNQDERRMFMLSNGEFICDAAGNAFSWVFDDVQGDENGIIARPFTADSPSVSTSPYGSMEKGAGWQPSKTSDWSGRALIRGGCWDSYGDVGVFRLVYGWPIGVRGDIGFRCTK